MEKTLPRCSRRSAAASPRPRGGPLPGAPGGVGVLPRPRRAFPETRRRHPARPPPPRSSRSRPAALAATFSLAAGAAAAQTFGEFLSKPELPVTFLGADFSNTRYYGPPLTVDQGEMKTQFTKINELLVHEADKYDIAKALHRKAKTVYAINVAEAVNTKIDPATLIVASDAAHRAAFTPQTVEGMVRNYTYPAGSTGIGLVFVVEEINKNSEQEILWATFVNMSTKQMLYTEKIGASGGGFGFGFRNHWAHPLDSALDYIKSHYGQWQKKLAKS